MKSNDQQFWMTAKYKGRCAECEGEIDAGDRIVWDTLERRAYCRECGTMMLPQESEHKAEEKW